MLTTFYINSSNFKTTFNKRRTIVGIYSKFCNIQILFRNNLISFLVLLTKSFRHFFCIFPSQTFSARIVHRLSCFEQAISRIIARIFHSFRIEIYKTRSHSRRNKLNIFKFFVIIANRNIELTAIVALSNEGVFATLIKVAIIFKYDFVLNSRHAWLKLKCGQCKSIDTKCHYHKHTKNYRNNFFHKISPFYRFNLCFVIRQNGWAGGI